MKGPGLRIDLDVRRVWRCSKCGRTTRTSGQVTAQRCGCTEGGQWMHLEPAVKKEPFRAPSREHLPEEWEVSAAGTSPAVPTEVGDTPAAPSAESPTPSPEQPAPERVTAVMAEVLAAETILTESIVVGESSIETPAPDPAVPPPDAFGAGVENPPQNSD